MHTIVFQLQYTTQNTIHHITVPKCACSATHQLRSFRTISFHFGIVKWCRPYCYTTRPQTSKLVNTRCIIISFLLSPSICLSLSLYLSLSLSLSLPRLSRPSVSFSISPILYHYSLPLSHARLDTCFVCAPICMFVRSCSPRAVSRCVLQILFLVGPSSARPT